MNLAGAVRTVVMQPGTYCNLDCGYCYLPDRRARRRMPPAVAAAVATSLRAQTPEAGPTTVVWHAGEPTAVGLDHFAHLVAQFDDAGGRFRHGMQTNATLLDGAWCAYLRERRMAVGVSLDGPAVLNDRRRNRGGRGSFELTMRGIAELRRAGVPFSAVAVIGPAALGHAAELYDFFHDLGCAELGINIEETEGDHRAEALDAAATVGFWRELLAAWSRRPTLPVREIRQLAGWLRPAAGTPQPVPTLDPLPTVGCDGAVVLLSPELLGGVSARYHDFVVGNVLTRDLLAIVRAGARAGYVRDFQSGVADCARSCGYYPACHGGQASNKFFEWGTTNATQTAFCRSSVQLLVDAGLAWLTERAAQDRSADQDRSTGQDRP